jgi:hypothetical protein
MVVLRTPSTAGQWANISASITSVLFAPEIALRSRAESVFFTKANAQPASSTAWRNANHVLNVDAEGGFGTCR